MPCWTPIVGKLADETTTGVWWQDKSYRSYAVALRDAARQQLATGQRWKLVFPNAQPNYFAEFEGEEHSPIEPRLWYTELRDAAAGQRAGEVKIRLQVGQATEVHWLTVVRVKHQNWGRYLLTGRFNSPSVLVPTIRPGNLVQLNAHQILEWRE